MKNKHSNSPETETEALKIAIREAHETLQDLRAEQRNMKELIKKVDEYIRSSIEDRIENEVKEQVDKLGKITEQAMRDSVARIEREFNRLEQIFTGKTGKSGQTLEELITTMTKDKK